MMTLMQKMFMPSATRFPHCLTKMFVIRYFRPYTQDWNTQSFNTLDEANRMIDFYRSCGSSASLI